MGCLFDCLKKQNKKTNLNTIEKKEDVKGNEVYSNQKIDKEINLKNDHNDIKIEIDNKNHKLDHNDIKDSGSNRSSLKNERRLDDSIKYYFND